MTTIKLKPLVSRFNFSSYATLDEIPTEARYILNPHEEIKYVFKTMRDIGIFTNERIIMIDFKGIRGLRKSLYSIFYYSISSIIVDVHNFETIFQLVMDSGYFLNINFLKPIPLKDVYEVYHYILNKSNKS